MYLYKVLQPALAFFLSIRSVFAGRKALADLSWYTPSTLHKDGDEGRVCCRLKAVSIAGMCYVL